MNFMDVLRECRDAGIRLAVKEGRLLADAPQGRIDPDLRKHLGEHKTDIVAYLSVATTPEEGRIVRDDISDRFPLSFSQRRLWFLDRLGNGSVEYNLSFAIRAMGAFDTAAMRTALDTIVNRHAVLRSRFVLEDDQPVQRVMPAGSVDIDTVDLSTLPADAREHELRKLAQTEAATPFDLAEDDLLRCRLVVLGHEEHAILFTLHHIAADGWSIGVLVREFIAHYRAATERRPANLPALPIQYGDFARWQHETLDGGLFRESMRFWTERLADAPAVHALPLDRPRPPRQSFFAQRHQQRIATDRVDALKRLAQDTGSTLFMVLQTAFAGLLSRWSGQRDIVIGTPTAGRERPETAPLIGFFNNTVACRFDVDPARDVRALLVHGRSVALDAFTHQHVPFDLLIETLSPERSLAYNPLCQVKFVLQNHDGGHLALPGLRFEPIAQGGEKIHFDLDLTATEQDGSVMLSWSFKAELFERTTIERMARAYARLLDALCAHPDMALRDIVLIDDDDRALLESLSLGQNSQVLRDLTVTDEVARIAAAHPDAVAVRCGEIALTYRDLDLRANRLAHALIEQGIEASDRVGVYLDASIDLIVALHGVLRTGAAYVPLDAHQSGERLQRIIEGAGIRLALHNGDTPLLVTGVDTLFMDGADREQDWFSEYPSTPIGRSSGMDDTAYVLYTSGSTGIPKGVEVPHRGMVDYCAFARESYYDARLAGSIVATSPAFDLTLPALFVPLLVGGTVELLPAPGDISTLAARLVDDACPASLLRLTPSHVEGLLALLPDSVPTQSHAFVIGGERFPASLARALVARFPNVRVYNHYGPTETVVGCCWFDAGVHLESLGDDEVPIGRPMHNTRLQVLDEHLRPTPPGVPGELFIGGICVARGYLGQPALTAERFLDDPHHVDERMYRSGDRVRWRNDGQLEFLGRVDDQVKLRGFRIELGEIEHHLAACAGVRQAAVRLIGEGDQARILGWIAADPDMTDAVRAQLTTKLPTYMLPAALIAMDALPLTRNGKVDKRALPMPDSDGTVKDDTPPEGETETRLAALWLRLLKYEQIGRYANFFSLGGHSLLATRLIGEISREFGRTLPVRTIFEQPTLIAQAAILDSAAAPVDASIPRTDRSLPLPLSYAQRRLWFVDRLEGGSAQYNMPSALRLGGALDVAALRRALECLVDRHESLRTIYIEQNGEPIQVIRPTAEVTVHDVDLRTLLGADQDAALQRLRREEARRAFDLGSDTMIRCTVARLAQDDTAVMLTLHHIASDGWSNAVIARELVTVYEQLRCGREPALPAMVVQYADYAAWQRKRLGGDGLKRELDYWRDRLTGMPSIHSLPLDYERQAQQDFAGRAHFVMLDADDSAAIRAFCERHSVTLFVLMRAVFALLIGRMSREQDIVIGTPVAGRVHRDLEGLIGLFVNTLVLRTDLGGNPRFDTLLEQCRRDSLEAYAHQEVPFETLVDELKPARSLSHNPLVQILLNVFESAQDAQTALEGLDATAIRSDTPESLAKADLTLYVRSMGGRLLLKWSYRTSLFDPATIQRQGEIFSWLLRQAISTPDARILDFALLPDEEQQHAIAAAAPVVRDYGKVCLPAQVSAIATSTPEATALIHGDRRIRYDTLDARGKALARTLLTQGIQRGEVVGLFADRGIEYVVGILACMHAGAMYLPLASELPDARIAFMLRDSGARLLLAQEGHLYERANHSADIGATDRYYLIALSSTDGDTHADADTGASDVIELPQISLNDLSHLLFTSGSTGNPKGVVSTHGALMNRVAWMLDAFPFASDEVCCLITSTAFVRAVWEVSVPLAAGCPLLVVDAETVTDLAAFAQLLAAHRVTRIVTAPSLARALTELDDAPQLLANLRYWFVSGEPLKRDVAVRIRSLLPQVTLCNLYGSTETMSDVSYAIVGDDALGGVLSIGKAIANCALLVLDERLRPLPPGVPGEICVLGANIAQGYLERTELTAEKFVQHGFGEHFGRLLYRTGDLGRVLPNGDVECMGRLDYQVKIRGFRIELGEIEARILRDPRVKDAVVMVRDAEHARLVAYVIPERQGEEIVDALRTDLRAWLPEYMQPSTYVQMSRFPITPNGKIDRRSLPEPELSVVHSLPSTPTGAMIAEVWSTLLGRQTVGADDDFFEIGGHSLLATRMANEVSARTGKRLTVRAVFEHPVLEELARHLDALEAGAFARHDIVPVPRGDGLPLSLSQQRLWFVDRFESGSTQYNMPTAMRIRGALDTEALQRAFDRLVARHEILRTTYVEREGQAFQIVHPIDHLPLGRIDLRQYASEAREAELTRLRIEDAKAPFDLSTDPAIRCTVIALGLDEHALLFCIHHIASDGWSKGLLVREFEQIYHAEASGQPVALPPLVVQYADYAAWQRSPVHQAEMAEDLGYWTAHLQDIPQVHALPLDRARPVRQRHEAARLLRRAPAELLSRLRDLAQAHDATLFMVLETAFALLVARWSGETDIVVGSPVAGRLRHALEPLIGCFVNTLVLRTNVAENPDFSTLLKQSRLTILDAYAHQSTPFEGLVEELRPVRDLSYGPIVQLVFALQNHERNLLSLDSLEITGFGQESEALDVDIHLAATENEDGLGLRWLYATSLFDASTIGRIADSYLALLEAITVQPLAPVQSLSILSASDRARIEAPIDARPPTALIEAHTRFEAHARTTPNALAVTCNGEILSYAQLDCAANRVAHWLIKQDVGPDSIVALCMERSIDIHVGILGVLKAGAAWLPLDPGLPNDRIEAILATAGVEIVLAHGSVLDMAPALSERTLLPMEQRFRAAMLADQSEETPVICAVELDRLAYVIYTSGSTGTPKGVANTRRGLANLALHLHSDFSISAGDRVLAFCSIGFDGSVFEWLMALVNGASLHVCTEEERHAVPRLVAMLMEEGIHHAAIPPAVVAQMPLDRDYALRTIVVAGEACDESLAWAWSQRCRVVNSYGPSESAVAVSHDTVVAGQPITLGQAIANVALQVRNDSGQLQPIGVDGELWIAGASLARGYLGQPELTHDRFVRSPDRNETCYRTGDRVRMRADGRLLFLGRLDDQIKIRGFRIEPGEIRRHLLAHAQVRDAVVIARCDTGDARLVAYVVSGNGADSVALVRELRVRLRSAVPDYMIPAAFVVMDALPLNRNGKVNHHALPAPDYIGQAEYVAPQGDTELRLTAIWSEVLGQDAISAQANFFEIGGHSLLATQVISHVADTFGRELPIRALFEHPSIAEFARQIEAAGAPRQDDIQPAPGDRPLPLSFSQQRLWFIDRLEGGSAQYNMRFGVRMNGRLDEKALQKTVDALVARHAVLRTTYSDVDGEAVQLVHPAGSQSIARHDLSDLDADRRSEQLRQLIRADAQHAFDLAHDPMLRCTLARLGDDVHALLLATHHIASDGWSMNLLGKEFAALYDAFQFGRDNPLPPLKLQYGDYAWWQKKVLQGVRLDTQLDYWRERLAGLPPVHSLRLDKPRPPRQRFEGAHVPRRLDVDMLQRLKQLALSRDASLFMVLEATLATLLGRWSGETDVVIGTPVAGRTQRALEPIFGFFINSLVLRTDLSGDPNFIDVVERVKHTALDAYSHQDVPFEMLVEMLRPERTLSHSPLFQISFTFHNHEHSEVDIEGLELHALPGEGQQSRYDIELHMTETDTGIHIRWVYATSLFEQSTIERIADGFETLLAHALADPQASVASLPIVPDAVATLLIEAGTRPLPLDTGMCVQQLVEAWAERTPNAVAVVCDGESIEYATLNREANRIAHHLRAQGVRADTLVGLCVDRSVEMIVGLLGILKAGGAYVPLDPSYPEARIEHMLQDSAVEIVLTQSGVLESLPMLGERTILPLDAALRDVLLAGQPDHDPHPAEVGADADSLAYVIYTSGSTGLPKGVLLEHRGLLNLALAQRTLFDIDASAKVLQFSSISFDASTWDWLLALANGASLHVCTQDTRSSAKRLSDQLQNEAITHALIPPAMLGHVDSERDYALRVLTVGGEACDEALAWRWARKCRLVNAYGPSENTVVATCGDVLPDQSVVLGRQLPNCTIAVVNGQNCLAPVGVVGELYVGGASLARGYLGRDALTAQSFIANPLDPRLGDRLYRTGDLVRWRVEGVLEFIGRRDDQIKLRGFRIELGEIESALLAQDVVAEAVVCVREAGGNADKRLVAYIVPAIEGDDALDPGALVTAVRSALKRRLPEYMVPAACVVLSKLPVTHGGKLDRAALPAPEAQAGSEYIAPATPTEMVIASQWAELLELDATSISSNAGFFDLGGHSILAIKFITQLGLRLDVDINVRDLFYYPTLAELAHHVDGVIDRDVSVWNPLIALDATPDTPMLYCVPAAGLTAMSYQRLARTLKGDLALQIFEPCGADSGLQPCGSMEEIVEINVRALLETQPHGPYLLAGHSFGGAVAFEMARVLEGKGHEVKLVLIDSILHLPDAQRQVHSVTEYLQRLIRADGDDDIAIVAGEGEEAALRTYFARRLEREGHDRSEVDGNALRNAISLFRAQLSIYRTYRPSGRFAGTVNAILAGQGEIAKLGNAMLKQHYSEYLVGDVDFSSTEGGHLSMVSTRHVARLASRLTWIAASREAQEAI
jgi:amino acid adenylation domain-containing protein